MKRRTFNKALTLLTAAVILPVGQLQAKTYLNREQAAMLLFPDESMVAVPIELNKAVVKQIRSATKTKPVNLSPGFWRTESGGWFVIDQVIGKHENIDMAYGLNADGSVKGLEILTYRESYGYEVANPKWRAQFHGKTFGEHLKLDHQIKNISGATLSCRHITDGINRLTLIWKLVLSDIEV